MMKKIREYFYKLSLKRQKQRAMYEIMQDIRYMTTFKNDDLSCDETPLRRRMKELEKKDERTQEEETEYRDVLARLAASKAVKNEFQKSYELVEDLKKYISLL